jgi:hypothetical protein
MKRRVSQPSATAATAAGTAEITGPKPRSRADRAAAKRFMALLRAGADTRVKKVKRIRQSVRTRSYENELKLSVAMDRMAQDLAL